MKKILLTVVIAVLSVVAAMAFPKAFYVVKDGTYTKYNFGVAGDLKFSNNGHTLTVTGYSEAIDLDKIDFITFSAPVENLALTPAAQKDKMIAIGEDIDSRITLSKYADVLNMYHGFFDGEEDANGNWHEAPAGYWLDPAYYDLFRDAEDMMRAAAEMVRGNAAAARVFKAKTVNLYKVEDYYGIYTANADTRKWDKTPADGYLEIRFKGYKAENYSVRLDASADFTAWNTADANVQLPKVMTVTFGKDGNEIAKAVITSALAQTKSIDLSLDFVCNDIHTVNNLKVVDNAITDDVNVTIAGQHFVTANTEVAGRNLVNYDAIKSDIEATQHSHDEYGNCLDDDDVHPLLSHFIRANAQADVIGRLQVKAKLFDVTRFYDTAAQEDDLADEYVDEDGYMTYCSGVVISWANGELVKTYDSPDVTADIEAYLNNYTDAAFYYEGEPQLQGFLSWEVTEDDYDMWTDGSMPYTIVGDNQLVYLTHENIFDLDEWGNEVWIGESDYYGYYAYKDTEQGEYVRKFVRVPDDKVIKPNVIIDRSYEIMPLLVFPDLSSYSFEDYFDEVSFKKLIDDYNDIIDTYLDLTGQQDKY